MTADHARLRDMPPVRPWPPVRHPFREAVTFATTVAVGAFAGVWLARRWWNQ